MTQEEPKEAISLKMSVEKTALSPGERFAVFFTVETNIPHNFRRFQHLPKVFKLAQVEEFPRKFKKGDKTHQKVSFIAPSGQVPSEFQLIFEFMFEKEDTSLLKITTIPLSFRILQPEEIPSDQLRIIADHKVDINGKLTTSLQEFPKMEGEQVFLAEEKDIIATELDTTDSEVITDLPPPKMEFSETLIEEQMELNSDLMESEDILTEISLPEDNTDMLTEKISEYTKRIVSLEDQLQKQVRDLKLREEELNTREEELMNLKNEHTRLDDALGKYREHVNDLERTLEELTPKLTELEAMYSERGKKISQLEETNTELGTLLKEKEEETEQQNVELRRLLNYKTQIEQQIASLTSKIKELELHTSDQSAKIIALEDTRKNFNKQLDEKTEEISALRKERDQLQIKQREIKRQITQLERQIEEELKPNVEMLQDALTERETKINQLKRRLNTTDNQLEEKTTVIQQQNKEIEALKEQIAKSESKVESEEQPREEYFSDVIEYYGPPTNHTDELIVQEETLSMPSKPETPVIPSEGDKLIKETIIEEDKVIPITEVEGPLIAEVEEPITPEVEEPITPEVEDLITHEIEEKKVQLVDSPKCKICSSSVCPTCGSTTHFCKVRCTHCGSIFHRHCAKGLLPSENDVFINCPNCNEKIVL